MKVRIAFHPAPLVAGSVSARTLPSLPRPRLTSPQPQSLPDATHSSRPSIERQINSLRVDIADADSLLHSTQVRRGRPFPGDPSSGR